MPEKSEAPLIQDSDSEKSKLNETDPSSDGRNKEWQDRSRVNLETAPGETMTNIERDFEPEDLQTDDKKNKKDIPAY
ncbi:MAG: hypothetical protein WKF89_11120 [Chitinophagaceae bacterium]